MEYVGHSPSRSLNDVFGESESIFSGLTHLQSVPRLPTCSQNLGSFSDFALTRLERTKFQGEVKVEGTGDSTIVFNISVEKILTENREKYFESKSLIML